ncbi:MFS transporter [Parapusillimonas sp. JC17]|uniref:MFS transporter n=1 Tax=Parapusillimonas sp. JC17 TaxID=3445768 RepID=UPI003F9FBA6E
MATSDPSFSLRKIAVAAFGPTALFGLAEGAIFPVIALSARDLGASVAASGLIVALIGVGSLLSNIPASILTARHGERRAMTAAAGLMIIALILCVLASSAWVLAAGVFMIGISQSIFMLARQTYLTEAVPITMRARAMSSLGGAMRVGMFLGPFVGAGLMHFMGLPGAYVIAIIASAAAGGLSLGIPDLTVRTPPDKAGNATHTQQTAVRAGNIIRDHRGAFLTLGTGCMLLAAVRSCRQIIIPLWASHIGLDPATTAIVYGAMGAIDMLLFYPSGYVMDRHGRRWVALPSMIIMGASLLLMPLSASLIGFIIITLILGLGNGVGSGLIMTIGADASPKNGRTHFLGIWRFITDLGACGGPLVLSGVAALATLGAGIASIGGLGLLAAVFFWRWLPGKAEQ